jgi:queuine tRNA-ribosyltransferase
MRIQHVLNSDIVMIFDECTPYPATTTKRPSRCAVAALGAALARRAQRLENSNALFGIVQGGMYEDLRDESLAGWPTSASTASPSAACRSANRRKTWRASSPTPRRACRRHKPRYLMGVGTPEDLVHAVQPASTCSTA